jgi:hypothetical protein
MNPVVDIVFDCLPLRLVGRFDVPLDASDAYRLRCERLKQAIDRHAGKNAYFLYNARCVYRLANSEVDGMLRFEFEGTVIASSGDDKAAATDLEIELTAATCSGLPDPVKAWFIKAVEGAVLIEFDRFVAEGNLARAVAAASQVDQIEDLASFAGMHL